MKLIVEMEMPKDCPMCPMAHYNKLDEFTGCEVAAGKLFAATRDKAYAESASRPLWCPIKGVLPEQHGDLVDRDEVKKEILKRMPSWCGTSGTDGYQFCSRREMLYPISHAKVIVAAERSEHGTAAD